MHNFPARKSPHKRNALPLSCLALPFPAHRGEPEDECHRALLLHSTTNFRIIFSLHIEPALNQHPEKQELSRQKSSLVFETFPAQLVMMSTPGVAPKLSSMLENGPKSEELYEHLRHVSMSTRTAVADTVAPRKVLS